MAGVRVQQIVLKVARPELDQEVLTPATGLVAKIRKEDLTADEEAFAELARGNSEDPATAKEGGWLPNPVKKNPNKKGHHARQRRRARAEHSRMEGGAGRRPLEDRQRLLHLPPRPRSCRRPSRTRSRSFRSPAQPPLVRRRAGVAQKAQERLKETHDVAEGRAGVRRARRT
jgi:hypothetical protein